MNYERPELLDKLAGAYVLGTMGAGARRRFTRLQVGSIAVQRAVADWHNRLAPLYGAIPAVAPPPALWTRIAGRIQPAADAQPAPRMLDRLRIWLKPVFGFALGAVVATAFVSHNAHLFGMHHMSAALPASYVGILQDEGGKSRLTVGSHRHGETMTIRLLAPLAIPPGRVARLWALPAHGAPVPVANVAAGASAPIRLGAPAEEVFAGIARLAVSFEEDPAAAQPTGPYVLSGPCVRFW
ncbi:anti-sigma factor [Massilia arenae]|uniref:anti-sigma factor n=1 Tax=Massilia arenae TaxID=2603288 RepID=UPI0016506D5D|nr:anti-sigma factor [Massilia arenae]